MTDGMMGMIHGWGLLVILLLLAILTGVVVLIVRQGRGGAKTMAVLLATGSLALVGCGGGGAQSGRAASPSPAAKQHDIRGRVEAISRERGMVTLDHEEIPGVMAAMKMEYAVADRAILDRVEVGDSVVGRIEDRSGSYVILLLMKR